MTYEFDCFLPLPAWTRAWICARKYV